MDVKHIIRTFYTSLKIPLLAFVSEFHASGSSKNQYKLWGKELSKKVHTGKSLLEALLFAENNYNFCKVEIV